LFYLYLKKRNSLYKIHFCNYSEDTEFHKRYSECINFDDNFIFETNKSYLDLFPRKKLVYLSPDAKVPMRKFDPIKVYIIGNLVDKYTDQKCKYATLNQASEEGIQCERFPFDLHVRYGILAIVCFSFFWCQFCIFFFLFNLNKIQRQRSD
jgi:hypothetical protein